MANPRAEILVVKPEYQDSTVFSSLVYTIMPVTGEWLREKGINARLATAKHLGEWRAKIILTPGEGAAMLDAYQIADIIKTSRILDAIDKSTHSTATIVISFKP